MRLFFSGAFWIVALGHDVGSPCTGPEITPFVKVCPPGLRVDGETAQPLPTPLPWAPWGKAPGHTGEGTTPLGLAWFSCFLAKPLLAPWPLPGPLLPPHRRFTVGSAHPQPDPTHGRLPTLTPARPQGIARCPGLGLSQCPPTGCPAPGWDGERALVAHGEPPSLPLPGPHGAWHSNADRLPFTLHFWPY